MKNSELIRKLHIIQTIHGDTEIHFSVIDHYGRDGYPARMVLQVGDTTGKSSDWFGSFSSAGETTINLYLHTDKEDKKPKITFRK